VDVAMAGWEQLSQNPEKMQELFASFKDPEVMAKAQEMLKDPMYMSAAKAKVAELTAKAQKAGMLDAQGNPVPGAATSAAEMMAKMGMGSLGGAGGGGLEGLAQMMGMDGGAGVGAEPPAARDYELEAAARHRAGELNDAELGMNNLQNAIRDPEMMKEVMKMMKDPAAMAEVKKMMSNPTFKHQAQQMVDKLKAQGGMPDFSKLASQMGGMGGNDELEQLRRENARLRSQLG